MIEVPLTRGMAAIIDDDDAERVMPYKWHAHHSNGGWYACRWVREDGRRRGVSMHRTILPHGECETDHINGLTLDNRRCNLRPASRSDNQANRRKKQAAGSCYKGISYQPDVRKWRARITVHGETHHIGLFLTKEDAAAAYDQAARKHFGEFAYTNFPSSGSSSL